MLKYKIKKMLYILFLSVFCFYFFTNFFIVNATKDKNINVDVIINDLNTEIGAENSKEMFQKLQGEISQLKDKTKENILNIINKISQEYGVLFTEEQTNILINYFENLVINDETRILDATINLFQKIWDWIKSLHSNSKVDIKPNLQGEQPLLESEGDTVTINIPTVEEVDSLMNKLIDKISKYISYEN